MPDIQGGPIKIEALFLDGPRHPLFCIHMLPRDRPIRGGIVYVHPFAEEMHKSRRMAALQARALAAAGYALLQVDLSGCGDSGGDFSDASWALWREDVGLACAWLRERVSLPLSLWGLRTGATLAAELAASMKDVARLVLWQPVVIGEMFLTQFLRIKLASEMLAGGGAKSDTKALRAELEQGATVEVGGYGISGAMARQLAAVKLAEIRPSCPVLWFEVGGADARTLSPASSRVVESWTGNGVPVRARVVEGDPFWLTQEITECPPLLRSTLEALAP